MLTSVIMTFTEISFLLLVTLQKCLPVLRKGTDGHFCMGNFTV